MFIVAKENPKAPEGWVYFKEVEVIEGTKVPKNTVYSEEACVFHSKEEAAHAYWLVCHYFTGYKIYPSALLRGKRNVT